MPPRKRPVVELRQPPTDHMQAFVRGLPNVQQSGSPEDSAPKRLRNVKRQRRQVTIYLEPELAKRLKLHAAMTGNEMSDVAASAISQHLDDQPLRLPDIQQSGCSAV